jgi:hypothetical protein
MRNPYKRRQGVDADGDLPEGKTCGDCFHFKRCNGIYGHIAEDEACDWIPSRFQEPKKETP